MVSATMMDSIPGQGAGFYAEIAAHPDFAAHPNLLRVGDHRYQTPPLSCRHSRNGFTLIELLAVIAIIAVLAALLIPVVGSQIEKAQSLKCVAALRNIGVAFPAYMGENNGNFPRVYNNVSNSNPSGDIWWQELAPYLGVERNLAAVGAVMRCPTHNATKKRHGMAAAGLKQPDFGMNFVLSESTLMTKPNKPFNLPRNPSTIWLVTEGGFSAGGSICQLDTYWLGGTSAAQGGRYLKGGVHNGFNNDLFVGGHIEQIAVQPKDNPTRYTSQNPWDPIWGR